ncbi:E3 ubiquitin-protein ligase MUL1 [Pelomyxa schiedti]|nr:E3 ubiquitin-protein ligase MUL1 [Pelomyxa schiedti]
MQLAGESFYQTVDLTSRIKEVLGQYPCDVTIIKELIQNADDAGASKFCVVYDKRTHGANTVMTREMAAFQGPALLAFNDSVFTEEDFVSICQVGASEKVKATAKTGRFGIGFNSVYHVTDLPSFVSSKFIAFFDPHCENLPTRRPEPGIRFDFIKEACATAHPDQFSPYDIFGCAEAIKSRVPFNGTLFRLPLRTPEQSNTSKLSHRCFSDDVVSELCAEFTTCAHLLLPFLRHVYCLEWLTWETDATSPVCKCTVNITNMSKDISLDRNLLHPSRKSTAVFNLHVSISGACTNRDVNWLVCNSIGTGEAQALCKDPRVFTYSMKLLPWGGAAIDVLSPMADGGTAFCTLPLPTKTGLPVHSNGFFELTANRRDVWFGDETQGDAQFKSQWNKALLRDIISQTYVQVILAARTQIKTKEQFYNMFPSTVLSTPWNIVVESVYSQIQSLPVLLSGSITSGAWVKPVDSLFPPATTTPSWEILEPLLLSLGMPVVSPPQSIQGLLRKYSAAKLKIITPQLVRDSILRNSMTKFSPSELAALLHYCVSDSQDANFNFTVLHNLRVLCTIDGTLTPISLPSAPPVFLAFSDLELKLLSTIPNNVVNCNSLLSQTVPLLLSMRLQSSTNIKAITPALFPSVMEMIFPVSSPKKPDLAWVSLLWEYLSPSANLELFVGKTILYCKGDLLHQLTHRADSSVIDTENIPLDGDCFEKLGMLQLDTHCGAQKHSCIYNFVHPSTPTGLLDCIVSVAKIKSRDVETLCKDLDSGSRRSLRNFLYSTRGAAHHDCISKLPLFESADFANEGFVCLSKGNHFLAPSGIESSLLSAKFITPSSEKEATFLKEFGLTLPSKSQFYLQHFLPNLHKFDSTIARQAVIRALTELTSLSSQDSGFLSGMAKIPCIESACGKLCCASELYDPLVLGKMSLLAEWFPHSEFVKPQLISALYSIGLQSKLSRNGILRMAKSISTDSFPKRAHAQAKTLLEHIESECQTYFSPPKKTTWNYLSFGTSKFQEEQREYDQFMCELPQIMWLPVNLTPLIEGFPFLPPSSTLLAKASDIRPSCDFALVSGVLPTLDVEVENLKKYFGWTSPPQIEILQSQLLLLAKQFNQLESKETISLHLTTTMPQLYKYLLESVADIDVAKFQDVPCVWVGCCFSPPSKVALSSPTDYHPYLHVLPADLRPFSVLLLRLGVRSVFQLLDLLQVLCELAQERSLPEGKLRLAISIVQNLGSSEFTLSKEQQQSAFLPTTNGDLAPATSLVYNDQPWVPENEQCTEFPMVHSEISNGVAAKFGAYSLCARVILSHSDAKFEYEDFAQHESVVDRIKGIIEDYPVGPGVLMELLQNAEDSGASKITFELDSCSYGSTSLLTPGFEKFQGPSMWCYNDSQFTEDDWRSISRIGQNSKRAKSNAIGRFGLGFNSVYNITDVPSFVSGSYLAIFDPQGLCLPLNKHGMRVNFKQINLLREWPDQFSPYSTYGVTFNESFQGTLFRFPLRAQASEIKSSTYTVESARALLNSFISVLPSAVVFLNSIQVVEVCLRMTPGHPTTIFKCTISRDPPMNAVSAFIKTPDYLTLLAAPKGKKVVSHTSTVTISSVEGTAPPKESKWRVSSCLGKSDSLTQARELRNLPLKLVPLAGAACRIDSNTPDAGRLYCFLPLPCTTSLPIHINGFFELSRNRRDLWLGEDVSGEIQGKSLWNHALIGDAVVNAYSELVVQCKDLVNDIYTLFPEKMPTPPWKSMIESVAKALFTLPILHAADGRWETNTVAQICALCGPPVVVAPQHVIDLFAPIGTPMCTPDFVRGDTRSESVFIASPLEQKLLPHLPSRILAVDGINVELFRESTFSTLSNIKFLTPNLLAQFVNKTTLNQPWIQLFWEWSLPDKQLTSFEDLPVLPTETGTFFHLKGCNVFNTASLPPDLKAAMNCVGVLSLSMEYGVEKHSSIEKFAPCITPQLFLKFVSSQIYERRGQLFSKCSPSARRLILTYLSGAEFTTQEYNQFRLLPLFETYGAPDFVSLDRTGLMLASQGFPDAFFTRNFLKVPADLVDLLVSKFSIPCLDDQDFALRFVIPNLTGVPLEVQQLGISRIITSCKDLSAFGNYEFIHNQNKKLCTPKCLFSSSVSQVREIFPPGECFPDDFYLPVLDKLISAGLNVTLSVDNLPFIATSIAADKDVKRKLGRAKKFLRLVDSLLHKTPTVPALSALLDIEWMPVISTQPSELAWAPWRAPPPEGLAKPKEVRPKTDAALVSHNLFILDSEQETFCTEFTTLFGWNSPPSNLVVCNQLKIIVENMAGKGPVPTSVCSDEFAGLFGRELVRFYSALQSTPSLRFMGVQHVAFEAPISAEPFLFTITSELTQFSAVFQLFGVPKVFAPQDYRKLLLNLYDRHRVYPLSPNELSVVSAIVDNFAPDQLGAVPLPDLDGLMKNSRELVVHDADWLPEDSVASMKLHIAHPTLNKQKLRLLGVTSLREMLIAQSKLSERIKCPAIPSNLPSKRQLLAQLVSMGDITSAKCVSFVLDTQEHPTHSLLSPLLLSLQGTALFVILKGTSLCQEELCMLLSEHVSQCEFRGRFLNVNNNNATLSGSYSITECVQVLSDGMLFLYDPLGKYLSPQDSRASASAKNMAQQYRVSDIEFINRFPDQLAPFTSLDPKPGCVYIRLPLSNPARDLEDLRLLLTDHAFFEPLLLVSANLKEFSTSTTSPSGLDEKLSISLSCLDGDRTKLHYDREWMKRASFFSMFSSYAPVLNFTVTKITVLPVSRETYVHQWLSVQSVGSAKLRNIAADRRVMPYGSVSLLLGLTETISPVGHLFSMGFPIKPSMLPVHINCNLFFGDEGSFRLPTMLSGDSQLEWNYYIMQMVSEIYVELLNEMSSNYCVTSPQKSYEHWPTERANEFLACCGQSFYGAMLKKKLFLTDQNTFELYTKLPFPDPAMPTSLSSFVAQQFHPFAVPSAVVKPLLDSLQPTDILTVSPHSVRTAIMSLQRKKTQVEAYGGIDIVCSLLAYCISDIKLPTFISSHRSLPLLPDSTGALHPISTQMVMATTAEQRLFQVDGYSNQLFLHPLCSTHPDLSRLLVDPTILQCLNIQKFSPETLAIGMVKSLPGDWKLQSTVPWNPLTPTARPSGAWLKTLWDLLFFSEMDWRQIESTVGDWTLIPLEGNMLCRTSKLPDLLILPADEAELLVAVLSAGAHVLHHDWLHLTKMLGTPIQVPLVVRVAHALSGITVIPPAAARFIAEYFAANLQLLTEREKSLISRLPIFQLIGSDAMVPLQSQHSIVDPDCCAGLFVPPKHKFLMCVPELMPLYTYLGVHKASEQKLYEQYILPVFHTMPPDTRIAHLFWILNHWPQCRGSTDFVTLIKSIELVPVKTDLTLWRKPPELFDPRIEILSELFKGSYNASFPVAPFDTPQYLSLFNEMGMSDKLNDSHIITCLHGLASNSQVPDMRALRVANLIVQHVRQNIFTSTPKEELFEALSSAAFIPFKNAQGNDVLLRFRDFSLREYYFLVFATMPVLPVELQPPSRFYAPLKILSMPTVSHVIKNLEAISEDLLDNWTLDEPIEVVFTKIFQFLKTNWQSDIAQQLRSLPMIPVGSSTLAPPSQVYFEAPASYVPLIYQVPRTFAEFDTFFQNLGVKDHPSIDDLVSFNKQLKQLFAQNPLNPMELNALMAVIEDIAHTGKQNLLQGMGIPDTNCRLTQIDHCLLCDAPWIVPRTILSQPSNKVNIAFTHTRISRSLARQLGICMLSKVVREKLDPKFSPVVIPNLVETYRNLTKTIGSFEFAHAVRDVLAAYVPEDTCIPSVQDISLMLSCKIVFVESLKSQFLLSVNSLGIPAPNGARQIDITLDSDGTSVLVDTPVVYISLQGTKQRVEDILSVAVSRLIQSPVVLPIAPLLTSQSLDKLFLASTTFKEMAGIDRGVAGQVPGLTRQQNHLHSDMGTYFRRCTTKQRSFGEWKFDIFHFKTGMKILKSESSPRSTDKSTTLGSNAASPTASTPTASVPSSSPVQFVRPDEVIAAVGDIMTSLGQPLSLESRNLLDSNLQLTTEVKQLKAQLEKMRAEMATHKKEVDELVQQKICQICTINEADTAIQCGHTMCKTCVDALVPRKCPWCRASITHITKIYRL